MLRGTQRASTCVHFAGAHGTGHVIYDAMVSVPTRASTVLQSAVLAFVSLSFPKPGGTGSSWVFFVSCRDQASALHRRQITFWLTGRIGTGGEVEVLALAAVRESREVQGLPVVAQDPGDERAPEASKSFSQPASPMPETQPEMQENRGDSELLRETDGHTLEVSTEAVAAKARDIPVMPPLAERQRHRLVHLPIRNCCTFLCDRSRTW